MLEHLNLTNVMVFDIETASSHKSYSHMSETFQKLWESTIHKREAKDDESPETTYFENAGLHAEFSKIVTISAGFFEKVSEDVYNLRMKSFYSHDEKEILSKFSEILNTRTPGKHYLLAHNGKHFDVPYLCKRLSIHQMPIPSFIDTYDLKPWESKWILDSKIMWGFGSEAKISLKTLCGVFDIPTPKDDIEGKDVTRVYWNEEDGIERIQTYCKKDVLATARVFCKIIQRNITINPLEL
jgi:DNA polymerase elongation subunit (family B)